MVESVVALLRERHGLTNSQLGVVTPCLDRRAAREAKKKEEKPSNSSSKPETSLDATSTAAQLTPEDFASLQVNKKRLQQKTKGMAKPKVPAPEENPEGRQKRQSEDFVEPEKEDSNPWETIEYDYEKSANSSKKHKTEIDAFAAFEKAKKNAELASAKTRDKEHPWEPASADQAIGCQGKSKVKALSTAMGLAQDQL